MALEAIFSLTLGLLLTWIVLSVSINVITDWIGARLLKSARDLQDAIDLMLQDRDLLNNFYNHSMIRSLAPRKKKQSTNIPASFQKYPILRGFTKTVEFIPGIIPTSIFADAMFDILVYDSLT